LKTPARPAVTVRDVRLEAVRKMLAGRSMDVVILAVAIATLVELLADGHPVPALVSAICGLVLLARRRAPAIAIVVAIAGQLALSALLAWHEPAGPFGLILLTFVVAGGLRPERAAWLGELTGSHRPGRRCLILMYPDRGCPVTVTVGAPGSAVSAALLLM
jgi:hypothetical protein